MLGAEHVHRNKEDFVNTNEVLTERRWASSVWRKTGRMRRADARRSPRSLLRGDKLSVRQSAPPLGPPMLIFRMKTLRKRERLAFAPGREDEPYDTAAASELGRSREDSSHDSEHFTAQPQRSEAHPAFSGCIQITWIDLP